MGDEIHYKEWRIDVMHKENGWEALIYRPSSPLHETSVPVAQDRRAVIEHAKLYIDEILAS
jgi:hypothetical protein